ncbi:hypothetical protein AB0L33_08755 [Streptomyces sp. NPDC052299]|uniref:hypothetical protein n=1 Tax=Streptomyces sp. NPDC052299 TaxID=3155054 RepID=UPI00343ABF9A
MSQQPHQEAQMMRKSHKALLTVSAAALLMMMNPATASAAYYGSETDYTVNYVPSGKAWFPAVQMRGVSVYFSPDGDYFRVKDTEVDGYAAVVEWSDNNGRKGSCVNKLGGGSDGTCNKNFNEDYAVTYRAALYDSGELVGWTYDWTTEWVR